MRSMLCPQPMFVASRSTEAAGLVWAAACGPFAGWVAHMGHNKPRLGKSWSLINSVGSNRQSFSPSPNHAKVMLSCAIIAIKKPPNGRILKGAIYDHHR
jgi:hypothetical protein